jgi:hypothetical protein
LDGARVFVPMGVVDATAAPATRSIVKDLGLTTAAESMQRADLSVTGHRFRDAPRGRPTRQVSGLTDVGPVASNPAASAAALIEIVGEPVQRPEPRLGPPAGPVRRLRGAPVLTAVKMPGMPLQAVAA